MSTHSMIGQIQPDGDILAAYCHFDAEQAAQTIVNQIAGKPRAERQAIMDMILSAPNGWRSIGGRDLTLPPTFESAPGRDRIPEAEMLHNGDGLSPRLYQNVDSVCDAMGCYRVYIFSGDLNTLDVFVGWTTEHLGTITLDAPIWITDHLQR